MNHVPFRIDSWVRAVTRWGTRLCIVGAVFAMIATALNSELLFLGIFIATLSALYIAVQPIGFAISAGLRDPSILSDRVRAGATMAGVAGMIIGWRVATRAFTEDAVLAGVLLFGTGVIAAIAVLRSPQPRVWKPPAAVFVALVAAIFFNGLPARFAGTKPRAYYNQMRQGAERIGEWQRAIKADSGRYATELDTSVLRRWELSAIDARLVTTPDGYRASVTSALLAHTELRCAIYEGGTPEPPASQPGVAACTPYPDLLLAHFGTLWLGVLGLSGVVGLVVRRRAFATQP